MSNIPLARTIEVVFYIVYLSAAILLVKNKRLEQLFQLITCSLLGVSLELFSVYIFKTYNYYSHFFVNIGDASASKSVPLWVGLGWGLLMPLAIAAGKKLTKSPFTAGMIAYVIVIGWDLIWDIIAIRTSGGMWVWHGYDINLNITRDALYGIPWMNYLGYSGAIVPLSIIMAANNNRFHVQANNVRRFWFSLVNYLEGLVAFIVVVAVYAVIYKFVPVFAITAFLILFIGTLLYALYIIFMRHQVVFFEQIDWSYILQFGLSYIVSMYMGFYIGIFQDRPWLVVVHLILMLVTLLFGVISPNRKIFREA
ncbi:hypothetical protein [Weissella paramesenteroides]|uniref:hypothetical protein n=1 Tax=Weissella paramesenteroides TaxID=1249 RepID=UPI003F74A171